MEGERGVCVGGGVACVWVWGGRGGKQRYKHLTSAKTWHTGVGNNHVRGERHMYALSVCVCGGGGS